MASRSTRGLLLVLGLPFFAGCLCVPRVGGFGGGSSGSRPTPAPTTMSGGVVVQEIGGDAEEAPPLPASRPALALEIGADVGTETMFHECTDPEGGNAGIFAGVGWRPDGRNGYGVRGGAQVAVLDSEHPDVLDTRTQLWAGPQWHHVDVNGAQGTVTAFIARSTYGRGAGDMEVEAWGAGLALDAFARGGKGVHAGMRLYADETGIYGAFTLGLGWMR